MILDIKKEKIEDRRKKKDMKESESPIPGSEEIEGKIKGMLNQLFKKDKW